MEEMDEDEDYYNFTCGLVSDDIVNKLESK